MLNKLLDITDFAFEVSEILPSEFSAKRFMKSGETPFSGTKFDIDRTPYLKKIHDFFSPYNNKNVLALMKGHQLGFNATIENGICYSISECPTNIMIVSANEDLAAKAMNRIDKAIEGFNLGYLLRVDRVGRRSKSTGDTAAWKQFAGGSLISFGGQSTANMRSNVVQIVIADECDTYKLKDEKAGAFIDVMDDRTSSYGSSRKIMYGSTPLLKHNSIIYFVFLMGDQQYYNVPCPKCGEWITFKWYGKNEKGTQYGILFDIKKNRVVENSVRYRCEKCENDFFEKRYKTDLLHAGKWIETTQPIADNYTSFAINSLYAPLGMKSWTDYVIKYQSIYPRAGFPDTVKLQSFHNSVLGLTWEEKGKTPKINKLQNNTRNYKAGTIPYKLCEEDNNGEIIMLSCACDLNGVMDGEAGDDVRLDYEVIAWSESGATYSIDHGSIGTFKNKANRGKEDDSRIKWTYRHKDKYSVWSEFRKVLEREYEGMNLVMTGVDTSHYTEYARDFVKQMQAEDFPVYEFQGDKPDNFRMSSEDTQLFKKSREVASLYLINVNQIKNNLADYMQLEATEDYQPSNFMNYPNSGDGKYDYKNYFSHYEGEQKKLKKNANNVEYYLWERKQGRQNHYFDVRVYNYAIREIITDMFCKEAGVEPLWSNTCNIFKNL